MGYGKAITLVIELGFPFKWLPKVEWDTPTRLYRFNWLCFGISFVPLGYVEHRMRVMAKSYNQGWASPLGHMMDGHQ